MKYSDSKKKVHPPFILAQKLNLYKPGVKK